MRSFREMEKLGGRANADTKDESYETLTTMAIIPPLYTDHVNGEILLTTYQDYKIYFPDSEAGRGAKCDEVAEDLKKSQDENVYSEDMSFEVVDHFTPAGRAVYEKLLRELHARANKTNLLEKIS